MSLNLRACDLCLEQGFYGCRKCNKVLCGTCLHRWERECHAVGKKPDCPFCRCVWKPQNFLVECPGVHVSEVTVVWGLGPEDMYKILPYMVDGKVCGWVVLDPKYLNEPIDLEDLNQLERVSGDLKDLIRNVEGKRTCIASDMPMEHVRGQFEKAGVSFEVIKTGRLNIYGTDQLYELIKASQTLDIGFF